jgi:hypothetical protein
VLVDLGNLLAEEFAALGAKDPTLCYLIASGKGGTRDFSSDIPEYLTQRAIAINERVVATAAKHPDVTEQMTTPLWEKVGQRVGKRIGAEKFKLLQDGKPDPTKYGDYCAASVTSRRSHP